MRTLKLQRALVKCCFLLLLAACGPEAWKQDADVRAAKAGCAGLPETQHYACIERHAVASLNPDVCRLAGIWVDDMCLQVVYEAASDPAICDHLYLEGVRPNCRAYHAARAPTLIPTPSAIPTGPLAVTRVEAPTPSATALAIPATPSAVTTVETSALPPTAVPPPTPAPTPTVTPDPFFGGVNVAGILLTGPDAGWAVTNPWQRGGSWPLTTGVIYRLTGGRWDPVPGAPIIPGPYACYAALSVTGLPRPALRASGVAGDDVWAVGARGGLYSCSHGGVLVHGRNGQWQTLDLDPVLLAHRGGAPSPGLSLHDIHMLDAEHGWAVGGQTILRYADGTWTVELDLDCCMAGFATVSMASQAEGWAGGLCGLYRYHQGAWARWEDPTFDPIQVTDLQAAGPDQAFAAGATSASCGAGGDTPVAQVWRYYDGRWEPFSPAFGATRLWALKMVSADEGWAVGEQRTTFGGVGDALALRYYAGQWEAMAVPSDRPLYTVDAASEDLAWAGGDGFYHFTPDTGWLRVEAGDPMPLIRPGTTDSP
jgi:hypothetical protein